MFCLALILAGFAAGAQETDRPAAAAHETRNLFIGIDWSVGVSAPATDRLDETSVDALFLTVTGGLRTVFPILPVRLRLGAGWFPGKPFRLVPGIELALLEKLNRSGALAFGLYAFADAHIAPSASPNLTPTFKLGLLVPVSPTGGLCLAAGFDGSGRPTASLAVMNGGYVSANGPYGHVR